MQEYEISILFNCTHLKTKVIFIYKKNEELIYHIFAIFSVKSGQLFFVHIFFLCLA
jgi:hypothetical protein